MTVNPPLGQRELTEALRAADELTRTQLVVEFGALLRNDPVGAQQRLRNVAAQIDLPNSTRDSYGEFGAESQFFAAATSLVQAPPQYFTQDNIVATMRSRGTVPSDIQSIEGTLRGRSSNVGFEPAVLAQHKVTCAKQLVANGFRFGWHDENLRQVYELGRRHLQLKQAETPTVGERIASTLAPAAAGASIGLTAGSVGLVIAAAATAAAVLPLFAMAGGLSLASMGMLTWLNHRSGRVRTARENLDQASMALRQPHGAGRPQQPDLSGRPWAAPPRAQASDRRRN